MQKFWDRFGTSIYCLLIFLIIGIGLFLRIKLYIQERPLWNDEISLYLNLSNAITDYFKYYKYGQIAPPLYLIITTIINNVFNKFDVLAVRFLSVISGCFSLLLFLILLNKTYKSKIAISIAMFLFAFNAPLLYYSNEFKPYIIDVLVIILLFLLYEKINIKDNKYFLLNILFFFILPFFSFASLIGFFAIITMKFFECNFLFENGTLYIAENNQDIKRINKKNKLFCREVWIAPSIKIYYIKLLLLYCIIGFSAFLLYKINKEQYSFMYLFWKGNGNGFLNITWESFNRINIQFMDYMRLYSKGIFFFFLSGVIIACYRKNVIMKLSLISLFFCYIVSFLNLYPFSQRLILFLIPIYIIFVVNILDLSIYNKLNIYLKYATWFIILVIFIFSIPNQYYSSLKDEIFNYDYTIVGPSVSKRNSIDIICKNIFNKYKKHEKLLIYNNDNEGQLIYLYFMKKNKLDIDSKNIKYIENLALFEKLIKTENILNSWIIIDSDNEEKKVEVKNILEENNINYVIYNYEKIGNVFYIQE